MSAKNETAAVAAPTVEDTHTPSQDSTSGWAAISKASAAILADDSDAPTEDEFIAKVEAAIVAEDEDYALEMRRKAESLEKEIAKLSHENASLRSGKPEPVATTSDRPQIHVKLDDIRGTVDAAERALALLHKVYVRGRMLVTVVQDRSAPDWLRRPAGAPVIVEVEASKLRELLTTAANFLVLGKKGWRKTAPPAWLVETLLARGEWFLPVLEGIADAPVFRADGSILDVPGYDRTTRLIYSPGEVTFPEIPESPTKAEAEAALDVLLEPFRDFPFLDENHDPAATLALVLSMIGRPAIDGVIPMFLSTAPTPGSGKGLLVDACSMIATGRAAPKMSPTGDDEEWRKQLLALAIESPPLVVIDNIEGALGSPVLAMALTAGEIKQRLLGKSQTITASLRPVWAATGNNVQLKGDLGRRVIPIGLDPKMEHPEDRAGLRDLLPYVAANRPRLVAAALTILRAYVVAGRPSHGKSRKGSFEAWDDLIRGAIIWIADADPLGGVERIREAGDTDLDNLRNLLIAWHEVFGDRAVTLAEAISECSKVTVSNGPDRVARSALTDALGEYSAKSGVLDRKTIGYALRRLQGRIVGGLTLKADGRTKRGAAYRVG